jgi:hypothetical protein
MGHFAKLNDQNVVIDVIVVNNETLNNLPFPESEPVGVAFLTEWSGGYTNWKQTSYSASFRKNFAGVGYTYDSVLDAFIAPKPFPSWLLNTTTVEPLPPGTVYLHTLLSPKLDLIKAISDEIVYHPVRYKILFGNYATADVQATFKVVKNSNVVISDNDVKTRVLSAINQFFALDNFDFGDSFYFSELSTFVMNLVSPDITNFIIVPTINNFGSLYEINCQTNEIFISGATAADIEIIDAVTASQLNTTFIVTNAG